MSTEAAYTGNTEPVFCHPIWRWEPWRSTSISHVSLGADRHVEAPEPMPKRRPIGFVRRPVEAEPLTWEGDNA